MAAKKKASSRAKRPAVRKNVREKHAVRRPKRTSAKKPKPIAPQKPGSRPVETEPTSTTVPPRRGKDVPSQSSGGGISSAGIALAFAIVAIFAALLLWGGQSNQWRSIKELQRADSTSSSWAVGVDTTLEEHGDLLRRHADFMSDVADRADAAQVTANRADSVATLALVRSNRANRRINRVEARVDSLANWISEENSRFRQAHPELFPDPCAK